MASSGKDGLRSTGQTTDSPADDGCEGVEAERDRKGASDKQRGSSLLSSLSPTPSHEPDAQRWRIQAPHELRSRPTLNLAHIHATHMASRAAISSACGTASFVVWLFAQSPQILTNYRRGSVDGLSLVFLAQWMAGDVTNLLGCLLTDQLTFQKLTAAWFCIVDMVLMGQYIVYSRRDAKRRALHHHHHHHRARSRSVLVRTDSTMEGVYTALFSPSHHHAHRHHSKKRTSRQRPPRVDLSASVDLPAPALPSQDLVRSQSENRVAPRPSRSRGSRLSRTRSTLNEEARKVAALLAGQMSLVRSAEEGQEEQADYFVRHHPHHYPASGSSRQSSRASSRASSRPTSRSNSRSSSAAASPKLGFHHRPHGTSSAHRHLSRLEPLPRIDSLTEAQVASAEEAAASRQGDATAPSTSAITIRPVPERSSSRKRKAAWGILSIIGLGSLAGVGTNAIDTLSARMVDGVPAAPASLLLGRLLSWLCTLLYLTSRLPQIYENHTRRSVAGLSILLFISAFLGNSLYAISILTSPLMDQDDGDGDYFRECMPFLLGSAGTLVFDAIILGQWMAWGGKENAEAEGRGVGGSHDEEDGHAHHDRHHQRGRPPRKHYGTMASSGGGDGEQTQVDDVPAARDVGD